MRNLLLGFVLLFAFPAEAATTEKCLVKSLVTPESHLPATLFRSDEVLELEIQAPFQKLVEEKIILQNPHPGKLILGSHTFEIKVKARGMSSLVDLEFPKLKIKVRDPVSGTALDNAGSFGINSHGYMSETGKIVGKGRLVSPLAVYREASAYDLLSVLEIPTRKTRRAKITYSYTDSQTRMTQPALLIEDIDKTATRYGGKEFELQRDYAPTLEQVDLSVRAKMALAQNMLGNWDAKFPVKKRDTIINVDVVELTNGRHLPIIGDFDLSSIVSGSPRYTPQMQPGFFRGKDELFRWIAWTLQGTRRDFDRLELEKALSFYLGKKDALYARLQTLVVDDAGRENIKKHLDAFYEGIQESNLFIPLARENAPIFKTQKGAKQIGQIHNSEISLSILKTEGEMSLVEFGSRVTTSGVKSETIEQGWMRTTDIVR